MTRFRTLLRATTALLALAAFAPAAERTFDFTYAFTITGLKPGQTARVWFPQPSANNAQQTLIAAVRKSLPDTPVSTSEPVYHTAIVYFTAPADANGNIDASVTSRIERKSIDGEPVYANEDVSRYLQPDALVPVGGRSLAFIGDRPVPADDMAKARFLFDTVFDSLTYSKAKPGWGRGDVNWVCDSKQGNCSDFHSLFISLARANNLPAKLEIGFLIPTADKSPVVKNYHCWAFFKPADKPDWVPVDISAAKNRPEKKDFYFGHLDENRVTFATGRDVVLNPKQDGPPLNFFVYPYAEVDGKPVPAEQIQLHFSATPVADVATQPAARATP